MRVHLITRVNLKMDPNFEFGKFRQEMLFDAVAKSVKNQTYEDFRWVGLVDGETEDTLFGKLMETFDCVFPSYEAYMKAVKGKEMFTIRLDSDDIPSPKFIEELVNGIDKDKDIQMVVANIGTDININTGEKIKVKVDYPIGFFGVYEKNLSKGCYEKSHTEMDYNIKYTSEYTDQSLWTRNIHGSNRGSKKLLYKYKF